MRFLLSITERGCVEDQPQQPGCRIALSISNALCHTTLLRLASEAPTDARKLWWGRQPRSVNDRKIALGKLLVPVVSLRQSNSTAIMKTVPLCLLLVGAIAHLLAAESARELSRSQ